MKRLGLVAILIAACAHAPHQFGQPVSLRTGETAHYPGLAVTFARVVSDSRCPANVTCIQKGDVVIEIQGVASGQIQTVTLNFDHTPKAAFLGHTVELQSVVSANPYSITIVVI